MADDIRPSRCLVRGSINIDEFFHVPKIVEPGETLSSTEYERRAGGKGANQAVAVARAGGDVAFVGAVGTDGEWLVATLRQARVTVTDILTTDKEPTGRAIIQLTPEGENSIILHRGANYVPLPSLATPRPGLRYTHLLLQNEIPFSSTLAYLSHAKKIGAVSVLNPSPLPTAVQLQKFPWQQLDWLVVNEGEAKGILAALTGNDTGTPQDDAASIGVAKVDYAGSLLRALHSFSSFSPYVNLVCTLGAHGAVALVPALASPKVLYVPAARLNGEVVDTTGAGDCFTGYLIAGLMQMKDSIATVMTADAMMNVLRRAVEASGLCVQKAGATGSIPDRDEVERHCPLWTS